MDPDNVVEDRWMDRPVEANPALVSRVHRNAAPNASTFPIFRLKPPPLATGCGPTSTPKPCSDRSTITTDLRGPGYWQEPPG